MSKLDARDVADLANMMFANEASLLIFNALVDIASGDLDDEMLEGDENAEPEGFPQVLAALGLIGPNLCFGTYGIGEGLTDEAGLAHLREAIGMLDASEEPDPLALLPVVAQEMRTIAALTVQVGEDGARTLMLYLNPAIEARQAVAHLVGSFREIDGPPDGGDPGDDVPDSGGDPGGNGHGGNGVN